MLESRVILAIFLRAVSLLAFFDREPMISVKNLISFLNVSTKYISVWYLAINAGARADMRISRFPSS